MTGKFKKNEEKGSKVRKTVIHTELTSCPPGSFVVYSAGVMDVIAHGD